MDTKNITLAVLSVLITIGYFYTSYVVLTANIPVSPLGTMVYGSVSMLMGGVATYFFGSSKGSADKDIAFQNMIKIQDMQKDKINV